MSDHWRVDVACIFGPIVVECVHFATPGHWIRREEARYLRVLGVGENVEVWCKLESVTGVVEHLGVQRDLFVGFEVRGNGGDENVDTGFLLLSVRFFVGRRGLTEESLAVIRREVSHSLV